MKRLILTSLKGLQLKDSGLADLIVPFCFKFAWGPLPPPDKLDEYLGPRLPHHQRLTTGRASLLADCLPNKRIANI